MIIENAYINIIKNKVHEGLLESRVLNVITIVRYDVIGRLMIRWHWMYVIKL